MRNKAMQYMLRHPKAYLDFQMTGRLPQGVRPQSPLIDAILRIAPRDRARMIGFMVSPDLGYTGSRRFHTVSQALNWIAPDDEVFGAFPAESSRIKAFRKALSFEDIAKACAQVPEDILRKYAKP